MVSGGVDRNAIDGKVWQVACKTNIPEPEVFFEVIDTKSPIFRYEVRLFDGYRIKDGAYCWTKKGAISKGERMVESYKNKSKEPELVYSSRSNFKD
jgi:hypothetical protein